MGYSRKPVYYFKSKDDTGIDKVPNGRIIVVEDYNADGTNKVKKFIKVKDVSSGTSIYDSIENDRALRNTEIEYAAVGNVSSPLLDLPLRVSLDMERGSGNVDFSRKSGATYIDRYGVLKYAEENEPRFEKEGLLIEGSSTNEALQSSKVLDSFYNTRGLLAEDKPDISGGTNAGLLYNDTNNSSDYLYTYKSHTMSVGDIYSYSVYVDISTLRDNTHCFIQARTTVTGASDNSLLKLYSNGSIEVIDSGNNFISHKVTYIRDSWYKMEISTTVGDVNGDGSDVTSNYYNFLEVDGDEAQDVNEGLIFCYPQLEKLPFATSYIPTGSSAVTRAGDACSVTSEYNTPFINNATTFSVTFDSKNIINTGDFYSTIFSLDYNGSDRILMFNRAGSSYAQLIYGTQYGNFQTLSKGNLKIICSPQTDTDINVSVVNDDDILIDDRNFSVSITELPINITLGGYGYGHQIHGHLRDFKIYDKALTPAEIRIL